MEQDSEVCKETIENLRHLNRLFSSLIINALLAQHSVVFFSEIYTFSL